MTMTVDLWMLFWAVVLTFAQMGVSAAAAAAQIGVPTLAGNRESLPERTGWGGRAERAYRNMLEALPLFAALVLIAHVAGAANAQTALGAQLFLYARVVYAVLYVVGVPWIRTLVWGVGVVGLIMIAVEIL